MPRKSIDVSGMRFSMLVAKHIVGKRGGTNLWLCQCDCGNETTAIATSLRRGEKKSCGCKKRMARKPRPDLSEANKKRATHAMTNSSTYSSWKSMKARCLNPTDKDYENYGGRGIRVCDRWLKSFIDFHADMGDRPKGKTIDRINNDGDYEPNNCKWSTPKEQGNNKRKNYYIEYLGQVKTAKQWAKDIGVVDYKTALYRLRSGWGVEASFTTPSTIKRK